MVLCRGYFKVIKLWKQCYRCIVAIIGSSKEAADGFP